MDNPKPDLAEIDAGWDDDPITIPISAPPGRPSLMAAYAEVVVAPLRDSDFPSDHVLADVIPTLGLSHDQLTPFQSVA